MSLAQLPSLPDHQVRHGSDPAQIKADYLETVKHAIRNHPRTLQTRIGPSEVDHACPRRIGYTLLAAERVNDAPGDVPWLPTIGTGGHMWLEETFTGANAGLETARWLVEMPVSVGAILGTDITGHVDLYDRYTATVIDHKIVGPSMLKKYKSKGPGRGYRGQIHLYGRGYVRRGLPVERVMIAFLPRNGELHEAYFWSEPYDEQVALDALQRAEGIALTVQALGPAGLAQLGTADAYCNRCPWYRSESTDPATGCPGDPAATPPRSQDQILSLV